MTVGIIVQTRTGSTRLPGKVMMKADDKLLMIDYVINQLKHSKLHDEIVVATTNLEQDDVIFDYVTNRNILCFRGDEKNVLERHYQCAKKYAFSTIVRIPSDKPLIDPTIVDSVIEKFQSNSYDYLSNFFIDVNDNDRFIPSYPSGTEVEIFSFTALETAWKNATSEEEKEHVTPYLYSHPEKFNTSTLKSKNNLSQFRWALDYENDLKLIRIIISKITKRPILMNDILELFEQEPDLKKIN
jgi:spore coat polysaccharide biosynthesis protein SpsF